MNSLGSLSAFEREVIERLLQSASRLNDVFRTQLDLCTVTNRSWTKVGSFTDLAVDRAAPSAKGLALSRNIDGCLEIWVPGLTEPAGHVIFLDKDGYLVQLEIYTVNSPPDPEWPETPTRWQIIDSGLGEPLSRNPLDVEAQN